MKLYGISGKLHFNFKVQAKLHISKFQLGFFAENPNILIHFNQNFMAANKNYFCGILI